MNTQQQSTIDRARQAVAETSRRTKTKGTGQLISELSAKAGTLQYWLEEIIALTTGASGEIQQGRIDRAREVLAETRSTTGPRDTPELMCDLASEVGKLGYWVEDMIALAAEVDGAPAYTPPALRGYGYTLPEDYLRDGTAPEPIRLDGCTCAAVGGSHKSSCQWAMR